MKRTATTPLVLALLFLAPAAADAAGGPKTVTVDCAKKDSINEALAQNASEPELVVAITGLCQEQVVIRRHGVTLRGTDPALDGITGPTGDAALVEVWETNFSPNGILSGDASVKFENLSIRNGDGTGLFIYDAGVKLTNCWVTDHGGVGTHLSGASFADVHGSRFANNGGAGVNVQRACRFIADDCDFIDNGGAAVTAQADADAFLTNSEMSGSRGVNALSGGRIYLEATNIAATGRGIQAADMARVEWFGGNLSGRIVADAKSLVHLEGVTQLANPGNNVVSGDSTVRIHATTLTGSTVLDTFSNGEVGTGSVLGSLVCSNGANLVCDGSETKTSSSCSLCP